MAKLGRLFFVLRQIIDNSQVCPHTRLSQKSSSLKILVFTKMHIIKIEDFCWKIK